MENFTQELIILVLGFTGNLILLGIGAAIARYTVSHYQKAKDANLIRESLMKLHSDIITKFTHVSVAMNQFSDSLSYKMTRIQEEIEKSKKSEKSERPFDVLFSDLNVEREVELASGELLAAAILLKSRTNYQLKLNDEENRVMDLFVEDIKEMDKSQKKIIEVIRKARSIIARSEELMKKLESLFLEVKSFEIYEPPEETKIVTQITRILLYAKVTI